MRQALPHALIIALLPTLALAGGPDTEPARGMVAVYRGTETNVPPVIPVLRGSAAMGSPPAPSLPEAPGPVLAVGGERLWLIDPAAGELIGCRLGGSTLVGVDRIRCTRRDFP